MRRRPCLSITPFIENVGRALNPVLGFSQKVISLSKMSLSLNISSISSFVGGLPSADLCASSSLSLLRYSGLITTSSAVSSRFPSPVVLRIPFRRRSAAAIAVFFFIPLLFFIVKFLFF